MRSIALAGSTNEGPANAARSSFRRDLDQLGLQVEVMALKVDASLQRSVNVLLTGDMGLAATVTAADDEIDAMLVSLTERCYDLLVTQSPVASDLRLVVSVLRILSDLERMGDLCLRIVKLAPDQPMLARNAETFEILEGMTTQAQALFRAAFKAWATLDLVGAGTLRRQDEVMDAYNVRLMEAILRLDGPDAVPTAVATLLAGRALERIADHSVMIGDRLAYMLTGDIASLSREIGPAGETQE